MPIVLYSQDAFVMSVLLDVDLLLYVFTYLSSSIATAAFKFITESIAACALLLFFQFTMEYFPFTTATDACLWFLVRTFRAVNFPRELYLLLCSHKSFFQTYAQ